jgi:hypothetical protein
VLGSVIAPLYYAQQFNEQATLEAYQTPALDIGTRNEARLKKMGIEGLPARNFLRNNYFTPTLQTALVLALESLGNIAGRDQVIVFAARAASETEARYVNNSVMMLNAVRPHRCAAGNNSRRRQCPRRRDARWQAGRGGAARLPSLGSATR